MHVQASPSKRNALKFETLDVEGGIVFQNTHPDIRSSSDHVRLLWPMSRESRIVWKNPIWINLTDCMNMNMDETG